MSSASTSWNCMNCNGLNYGTMPMCILCNAPSPYAAAGVGAQKPAQPSAAKTASKSSGFCGECGAPLIPGVQFCGECGARAPSAQPAQAAPPPQAQQRPAPPQQQPPPQAPHSRGMESYSAPRQPSTPLQQQFAPPPHLAQPQPAYVPPQQPPQYQPPQYQPPQPHGHHPPQQTPPAQPGVFCPSCGKNNKPTAAFCRTCGAGLRGQPAPVARHIVNPGPTPPPPVHPRPTGPDGRENAPVAKTPGLGARVMKKLVQNAVSIASMVVTYYLTQKFMSSSLQAQFGDMGRQLGPAMISLAVGGISRTFLQSVMK